MVRHRILKYTHSLLLITSNVFNIRYISHLLQKTSRLDYDKKNRHIGVSIMPGNNQTVFKTKLITVEKTSGDNNLIASYQFTVASIKLL